MLVDVQEDFLQAVNERFSLITRSPGVPHAASVAEFAETLLHAFHALGHEAGLVTGRYGSGTNVVLSTTLTREALPDPPPRTIVFNMEQFDARSPWFTERVRTILRECVVWDYNDRNLRNLQAAGLALCGFHVPVGYVPEMARIEPAAVQDIDVLFYGSINARRAAVLQNLANRQLKIVRAFNVYGAKRDALIARAKVVLNVHYYEVKVFEIVRVSYLWTNRKAVVTEECPESDIEPDLREGLAIARYDELPEVVEHLVRDDALRRALEDRGFEAFRRHPQAPSLARALELLPWS
ncbi:MAG: hypothetical protein ACHP7B_02835 [Burkholderiales bacterium]